MSSRCVRSTVGLFWPVVLLVQTHAKPATLAEFQTVAALQPKFAAELATLRSLKAAETKQGDARLEAWDISYYTNKLLKDRFAVDTEALRVYFPYQATLEGMFAIYQEIFGLKFTAIEPPYVSAPGVQLYVVEDATTGAPMSAFYLDMFPREGKYNHFACFSQKQGGVMADGRYDLPVAALICNFPAPSPDKPSLLKQSDVVTLFHEFGHVMHAMLSRSRCVYHTAFAVPQDFVEAPSQMLENWARDKTVLDTFAAYFGHYAGYDAGYYGYQWARVLAIDMASEFTKAPGGFLDTNVGRRLRNEVYGVGHTRDVAESVEKFLGRPRSQPPFLDYVGIKK